MTPEAKIKTDIRVWFRKQGAYIFAPVQTGYGASTVDQLICFKGKFIGIEAKVPGKHPTARQLQTLAEIRAAGGLAICADSLGDVKQQLEGDGWTI